MLCVRMTICFLAVNLIGPQGKHFFGKNWTLKIVISESSRLRPSENCPTIPISSGSSRFCSEIPNPDQYAIGIGFTEFMKQTGENQITEKYR